MDTERMCDDAWAQRRNFLVRFGFGPVHLRVQMSQEGYCLLAATRRALGFTPTSLFGMPIDVTVGMHGETVRVVMALQNAEAE